MKTTVLQDRNRPIILAAVALLLWTCALLLPSPAMAASDICLDTQNDSDVTVPEPSAATAATAPNCRYGVTASAKGANQLAAMKIGWVVSFGAREPSWLPENVTHTPMIRLKQNRDAEGRRQPSYTASPAYTESGLGRYIRSNPGAVWIVGNEVDRIFWQDDLMPDVYAIAYHDAYQFIKQMDPTAKVAVSGLVLVSPGRLQYLDLVLDAYRQRYGAPMPVDVWTFHAYIFPERNEDYDHAEGGRPVFASIANGTDRNLALLNPLWVRPLEERLALCERDDYVCVHEHDSADIFMQQVVAMRTWMKARGYQNTPLQLTEWSLLHPYNVDASGACTTVIDERGNCFTPPRVTQFMERTVQYLESAIDPNLGFPLDGNRLVQQWAWFALDDADLGDFIAGNPSLLLDPITGMPTQMGNKYRDLIQQSTTQPNLVIEQVFSDMVDIDPQTGAAVAQLKVSIRNNGNTPTTEPFDVKFYRDAGLTQEIGRATVPAGLDGCAVNSVIAAIEWEEMVDEGAYRYWVEVDGENAVDAVAPPSPTSAVVLVNLTRLFLPSLHRCLGRSNRISCPCNFTTIMMLW